jgi:hypothetical protein
MSNDTVTPNAGYIDSHRAALLHFAVTSAIETQMDAIKLKGALPFAQSIALMISALKAEQEKLEVAFPRLKS